MHLKSIIAGLLLGTALSVQAADFLATNSFTLGSEEIVSDELWVQTGQGILKGTLQNDLFIASGTSLLMAGRLEGNLWGAVGTETIISGHCLRNVRVTAQSVRIEGTIDGNVMILANAIVLGTNAVVMGEARLIGASVINEGRIGGKATITAARIATLDGRFDSDVKVIAPEVLLTDDGHIAGNLHYTANTELIPADGVVEGSLDRIVPSAPPLFDLDGLPGRSLWFFAALLTGIPFIALFPMTTAMASLMARRSPLKCMGVGLLAFIIMPAFAISSITSIIGIPIGALVLASWGIFAYVGRIIMGLMIGTLVLRASANSIGRVVIAMATGLAIIYFITLFPAISLPALLVVTWMGMGSLLLALMQKRRLIIQIPEELKHLEELKKKQEKTQEESP